MATLVSPNLPDERGRYGLYGGRYVPETLMALLDDLEEAYREARQDPEFQAEPVNDKSDDWQEDEGEEPERYIF